MVALASPDVVAGLWRPLTDDERRQAANLLRFASSIIRTRVPDVDERIAAGKLDADLAGHVAASMVIRVMQNPTGVKSETESIDDYTHTVELDEAHASAELCLTDEELHLLRRRRSRAFSITPSTPPATLAQIEAAAANRQGWR